MSLRTRPIPPIAGAGQSQPQKDGYQGESRRTGRCTHLSMVGQRNQTQLLSNLERGPGSIRDDEGHPVVCARLSFRIEDRLCRGGRRGGGTGQGPAPASETTPASSPTLAAGGHKLAQFWRD